MCVCVRGMDKTVRHPLLCKLARTSRLPWAWRAVEVVDVEETEMGWRWGPRGSCKGWNVLARRPPEVRWRSAEPVPRAVLGDKAVERVVRTVCASLRAMGSVVAGENGVPEGECILAFAANKERPAWGRVVLPSKLCRPGCVFETSPACMDKTV